MANELNIEIGGVYKFPNGDLFKLEEIKGAYFTLYPLQVSRMYCTGDDGLVIMKAIVFSEAVKLPTT